MKRLKLLLLIATIVLFAACERPVKYNDEELKEMAVTYKLIEGAWELREWQGNSLADGTFLYVKFDGAEHRFEMWDNLGSMYVEQTTGMFSITQDENGGYMLTGQYDYGVGDWKNDYRVKMMANCNEMLWATDDEYMIFSKIDVIPEFN